MICGYLFLVFVEAMAWILFWMVKVVYYVIMWPFILAWKMIRR